LRPKLTILLMLIVITPLAIAGWLGARLVRDEQTVVEHQIRELILGRLRAVESELTRALERYEQAVLAEFRPFTVDLDTLRRRTRESPYVEQYYVLDGDGRFLYPPVRSPTELTDAERRSLTRTRTIWDSGVLLGQGASQDASAQSSFETSPVPSTGWHAWYWGNGLQLMLWARDGAWLHAAEINRTRLLAELIGSLPETDSLAPTLTEGRIRLTDSTGQALYQWGSFETDEDARPAVAFALGPPLGAWSLEYHASSAFGATVAGGFLLNLMAGLALLAAVVIGMTTYFYREQSREIREAMLRVSFVNQVSHELKTPLTNIRMYAELLERDVDDEDRQARRHLSVIVSESQRLSRLIGNVLTFSRKQRRTLTLHRKSGIVDDVLRGVLDHFQPALRSKEIDVEFRPGADDTVSLDADAVEQIVGNLVSNVEKYGAGGKLLELTSRRRGEQVEITVADRGPGLAPRERQRIFELFYRVNDALTEGVSGTGIGLTISRELARLHGGDLQLEPSEAGARFRLTLHCPPVTAGG